MNVLFWPKYTSKTGTEEVPRNVQLKRTKVKAYGLQASEYITFPNWASGTQQCRTAGEAQPMSDLCVALVQACEESNASEERKLSCLVKTSQWSYAQYYEHNYPAPWQAYQRVLVQLEVPGVVEAVHGWVRSYLVGDTKQLLAEHAPRLLQSLTWIKLHIDAQSYEQSPYLISWDEIEKHANWQRLPLSNHYVSKAALDQPAAQQSQAPPTGATELRQLYEDWILPDATELSEQCEESGLCEATLESSAASLPMQDLPQYHADEYQHVQLGQEHAHHAGEHGMTNALVEHRAADGHIQHIGYLGAPAPSAMQWESGASHEGYSHSLLHASENNDVQFAGHFSSLSTQKQHARMQNSLPNNVMLNGMQPGLQYNMQSSSPRYSMQNSGQSSMQTNMLSMQTGVQPDLQASSNVPDISGALLASASSQHDMLNSWHTAAASGSAATSLELNVASSTQESTNTTSAAGELAQAGLLNQNLDGGSRIADTTHPVSEPHILRARLRLALAAVRTTVDNDSWSLEHVQSLYELLNTFLAQSRGDRGDQAYFRLRALTTAPMQTGDVALIRGGKLNRIGANGPYQFSDSDQFGIVSDTYVKWRGGKVPTLEEEPKGHWIAAIGQLPVLVSGAVGCNQFIVASLTNSPMGQPLSVVSDPSAHQRVVALTLEAKETEAPGLVMAFAMFGLPAIAGMLKTEMGLLWTKVDSLAEDMEKLKLSVPQQVDRLDAQSRQMAHNIQELKLSRLISPPKEQEAKLFWQRFCGLPQSSEQTVGQEEQLHKLLSMVADSNNKRNVYVILGTPGMGKTTLAKAFGRQLWTSQQVDLAFFVDLKEVNSIEEGLLSVYMALEAAEGSAGANRESRSADLVTRQICALLRQRAGTQRLCLVLDNAEGLLSSAANVLVLGAALAKLLECMPTMVIIITSRVVARFVDLQVHTEAMKPLTPEDAAKLMCLVSPNTSQESAAMLAKQCANIPYAVRLIGDSISEFTTAEDMVDELSHAGFVEGLKVTAETAYIALQRCVASSLKVLQPCDRLSLAQLSIFPSKFSVADAAAVLGVDDRVARRQLRLLQERSLVIANTAQTDHLQGMHQQYELHLFIRDMASSDYENNGQYLQARDRFVEYYTAMFQAHKHRHTPEGIESLRQLAAQRHNLIKLFALMAAQHQPMAARLLPSCCKLGQPSLHAIWLLRLDLTMIISAFENLVAWARACSLHGSVIDAQAQLGYMLGYDPKQTKRAETESQAALDAARQHYGQDDLHVVMPLMALGDTINDKVNAGVVEEYFGSKQVRRYFELAHKVMVKAMGESHPETLACALAACEAIRSSQEQIQALRGVLDTAQRELQPDHPAVLNIRASLGEALSQASHSHRLEAIPFLREYLAHCMKQLGSNERLVPEAMLSLGSTLVLSKQRAHQPEGLQLIEQAIEMLCKVSGDTSEDVIIARQERLALALLDMKQPDAAIQLLKETLQLCEVECGENSRIVQVGLHNLADAYEAKGDYLAAARELAKAHAKIKKCAAKDSSGVTEDVYVAKTGILCDIASNLELQGRYIEADKIHVEALQLLRRTTESDIRAHHCEHLADLRRMQARFSEAHKLLKQAEDEGDGDEQDICNIQYTEAVLNMDRGNMDAAVHTLESLAKGCEDEYIQLHALNQLGWHSFTQGSWSDAMSWFEQAVAMLDNFSIEDVKLEGAISCAGAATARLHLQRSGAPDDDETRATQLLHDFPFQQADGVQMALYCLATCKMSRGLTDEANQLYAQALEVQRKVYAGTHPSNVLFEAKAGRELHTKAPGVVATLKQQCHPAKHNSSKPRFVAVADVASLPRVDV